VAVVTDTPPSMVSDDQESRSPRRLRVSLRVKLLAAFAGAFTIVFVFIAIWVFQFTSDTTKNRLVSELAQAASGGAATIDAAEFVELVTTVPAVPGPQLADGTGAGYPDSPLYESIARDLLDLRLIVADAGVYSYFKDPDDGQLYFAASAGYLLDPQRGVTYKVPVADIVGPTTYAFMEQGLVETTNEPEYSDQYGSFISAYSPILDEAGNPVGAVGLDYPLTYVAEVEAQARQRIIPIMLGTYVVLLLLVLVLSTTITRPVKRLTSVTTRIAEGDYQVDVNAVTATKFPDELSTLANSFAIMVEKVAAREQSLTQEVQRLKVEIDQGRREEAVREITESDSFADIASRAADMRRRMRERDEE
jgi:HAMP domain-containing protein